MISMISLTLVFCLLEVVFYLLGGEDDPLGIVQDV